MVITFSSLPALPPLPAQGKKAGIEMRERKGETGEAWPAR